MASEDGRLLLAKPIEVVTEKGFTFTLRPVQGGKGVAVVPKASQRVSRPRGTGGGRAGRPPNPSTLALRERLAKDAKAGKLHAPAHYVEWMREQDPSGSDSSQRQIVYKERRAAIEAHPGVALEARPPSRKGADKGKRKKTQNSGVPGRGANASTLKLREVLEQDAQAGHVKDPPEYVQWLLDIDKSIGLKAARQLVYRERRRALSQ